MHLSADTLVKLRPYIVTQLDAVSDGDNDMLTDFILELIKNDGDEATLKQNAKEQLSELMEGGDIFVDNVFEAIRTKSYDPSAAAQQSAGQIATGTQNGGSRKRSFRDDGDDVAMQDAGGRGTDNRPMKSARRGRGDFARGRGGRGGYHQQQQGVQMGFDLSDPMTQFMMQQAMMSGGMPFGQPQQQQNREPTGKRCYDYDNKGVCLRGANCPFDHGTDFETSSGDQYPTRGARGGRGRGDRGRTARGGRAAFSSSAPNSDRNNKAIVIENIPEENLNEESIRAFFGEFGTIEGVSVQEERRLAVISYADHDSAQRAHSSPKVIFDNRFVKVYWYKPEQADEDGGAGRGGRGAYNGRGRGHSGHSNGGGRNGAGGDVDMDDTSTSQQIDPEAFAAQQAAAQERFEAQRAARAAREEFEAKIKAQAAERAALLHKLAEKTKGKEPSGAAGENPTVDGAKSSEPSSQTEALKAKLAALEEEARSVGINPSAPDASSGYPPRGRGYGRGGYVPRGRGGYRGRGGAFAPAGGAVKRLDNRPRAITLTFADGKWDDEKEEAVRQFLLFVSQ